MGAFANMGKNKKEETPFINAEAVTSQQYKLGEEKFLELESYTNAFKHGINNSSIGLVTELINGEPLIDIDKHYDPEGIAENTISFLSSMIPDSPLFFVGGGLGKFAVRGILGKVSRKQMLKQAAESAVQFNKENLAKGLKVSVPEVTKVFGSLFSDKMDDAVAGAMIRGTIGSFSTIASLSPGTVARDIKEAEEELREYDILDALKSVGGDAMMGIAGGVVLEPIATKVWNALKKSDASIIKNIRKNVNKTFGGGSSFTTHKIEEMATRKAFVEKFNRNQKPIWLKNEDDFLAYGKFIQDGVISFEDDMKMLIMVDIFNEQKALGKLEGDIQKASLLGPLGEYMRIEKKGEFIYGPKSKQADILALIRHALQGEGGWKATNPEFLKKFTNDQIKLINKAQNAERLDGFVGRFKEKYDNFKKLLIEEEAIKTGVDDYLHRIIDPSVRKIVKDGKVVSIEKMGKGANRGSALAERKFEDIFDAWAAGYDLLVPELTHSYQIYAESMIDLLAKKKLLKDGARLKMKIKDGNGKVHTTSFFQTNSNLAKMAGMKEVKGLSKFTVKGQVYAPKEIKDKSLIIPKGKWVKEGDPKRVAMLGDEMLEASTVRSESKIYAPEEAANYFNAIWDKPIVLDSKFFRALQAYNTTAKSWILSTSLFHHMALTRSYMFGVSKHFKNMNPIKAAQEGFENIVSLDPLLRMGVKNGLTLGQINEFDRQILRASDRMFEKMVSKFPLAKEIVGKINAFRRKQEKSLFERYQAGIKAKAFCIEYKHLLDKQFFGAKAGARIDPELLAKRAAQLINDDFGGLHWKRLGMSPKNQAMLRFVLLAPDWTTSNIRTMKQAALGEKDERTLYQRFWLNIALKGVTTTALGTAFLNGDQSWNEVKKAWNHGKLSWLGMPMNRVYRFFGYTGNDDRYFSLIGHLGDPIKWTRDYSSLFSKASVITRLMVNAMTGRNWQGRPYTDMKTLMEKKKIVDHMWAMKPNGRDQLPSFTLDAMRSNLPTQMQYALEWYNGEIHGIDFLTGSLGIHVKRRFPKKGGTSLAGIG